MSEEDLYDKLVMFISYLRASGYEVILEANINNNCVQGNLTIALRQIRLLKSFYSKFNKSGPASCLRRSKQIDGVWSLSRVLPSNIVIFLHYFGSSDHRVILVNFKEANIVRTSVRICQPEIRRLISDYSSVVCN